MAISLINWSLKLGLRPAHRMHVMLVLANHADETTHLAWPSLKSLCEQTSLDRKTVIADLNWFCEVGLLKDTGQRKGTTGQIKCYYLDIERVPSKEWFLKRNGSFPPTQRVPSIPHKSPFNPMKESLQRNTEPSRTIIEPSLEPSYSKKTPKPDLPDWIGRDAWEGFLAMRKAKKAPLTDRAYQLLITELQKIMTQTGATADDLLNQSTLNNWTGVFPLKDKSDERAKTRQQHHSNPGSEKTSLHQPSATATKLRRQGIANAVERLEARRMAGMATELESLGATECADRALEG